MKRTQKWIVIAGAIGSIFVVGFAAREMLFAQQNNRPQNDKWGPNSIPLSLSNPTSSQLPMPAMVPPGTTPHPYAVSPYPGGPIAAIPQSRVEQWTPGPQAFTPSHPNQSYPLPSISLSTGYLPSPVQGQPGVYAQPGVYLPPSNIYSNNIYLSPASHSNTLATSRLLQQYATCNDEAKKEELVSQIRKLVTIEFEEKHSVIKRLLESLEKTTQKHKEATEKREASKDKIIADRVANLIGRIDGTAWDFGDPTATEFRGIELPMAIELPMVLNPALGAMSAPTMPNPAYAPYPHAFPAYPTPPQPSYNRPGAYTNPTYPPAPHVPSSPYPPTIYPSSHPSTHPPAPNPPAITPQPSVSSAPAGVGPASLLPTDTTATSPSEQSPSEQNEGESNEGSSKTTEPSEPRG